MTVADVYIKVAVTLVVLTIAYGFTIHLDNNDKVDRTMLTHIQQARIKRDISSHYPSVHHYARHGLCRSFTGKQYFYTAMKTKLCAMRLSFVANFVIDLCRHRNMQLDKWVAELFDIDGDGYITPFERNIYVDDD